MVFRYKSHSNMSRGERVNKHSFSKRKEERRKKMKAKHQKNPLYILQLPHRPTLHKYEIIKHEFSALCFERICLPMQEMLFRSLHWEDLLEQAVVTHSSILAWKNSMDRGAWWFMVHWVAKNQTWLSIVGILVRVRNLGYRSIPSANGCVILDNVTKL